MLEAWFNEAVVAHVTQVERELTDVESKLLEAPLGEQALFRQTQLSGKMSQTCYLTAEAWILPERLPEPTFAAIQSHEAGIGQALQQARSETLREVLEWHCETSLAWRRYRIIMGGRVVACITERFPLIAYQSSSAID